MPLILPGNVASATASTTYEVANSCRWNEPDDPSMLKTSASGNQRTFTVSVWLKRSKLGAFMAFYSQVTDNNNYFMMNFQNSDKLDIHDLSGGAEQSNFRTTAVFRDTSAWYHIVCAVDTTQATEGNRFKIWVNGTQQTVFDNNAYPDQNDDIDVNVSGEKTRVGAGYDTAGYHFDGYLAEVCSIDGTAYTASDFGEFDEDSPTIWKPKDVSGLTFGTNGFYLDFEDSSNLGNDANGGTDLTETNLAAADQATDTPTNNFCTFNTLHKHTNITFSEGNCKWVSHASSDAYGGGIGTFGLTAGKWWWEVKIASTVANHNHGVISELCPELYDLTEHASATGALQIKTGVTCWLNDDGGEVRVDGTATTADYGLYSDGDIMGIALDIDNYNISYYKNGSALVSDFNMSTTRGTIFPFINTGVSTTTEVNFGGCSAFAISSAANDANGHGVFEYAPPSGFLALCTKNLGEEG